MDLSKYIEGLPLIHENHLILKNGDMFNIRYTDGEGEFKVEAKGIDLRMDTAGELQDVSSKNKDIVLDLIFDSNGCRVRSDDDIVGLYGSDTEVKLSLEEGMEGLNVEIYYNYLSKSQTYKSEPYLMYIIDNTGHSTNTLNNVDYLIDKHKCTTELYTTSPLENFNLLKNEYKEKGIDLEVNELQI